MKTCRVWDKYLQETSSITSSTSQSIRRECNDNLGNSGCLLCARTHVHKTDKQDKRRCTKTKYIHTYQMPYTDHMQIPYPPVKKLVVGAVKQRRQRERVSRILKVTLKMCASSFYMKVKWEISLLAFNTCASFCHTYVGFSISFCFPCLCWLSMMCFWSLQRLVNSCSWDLVRMLLGTNGQIWSVMYIYIYLRIFKRLSNKVNKVNS